MGEGIITDNVSFAVTQDDFVELMNENVKQAGRIEELERDRDEAHRLHAEISQSMLAGQLVRDLLKERAERAEAQVAVLEQELADLWKAYEFRGDDIWN